MFFIDGAVPAREDELTDREGERGLLLTLAAGTEEQNGIPGSRFPWGQTGIWARGDGTYWFSQQPCDRENHPPDHIQTCTSQAVGPFFQFFGNHRDKLGTQ